MRELSPMNGVIVSSLVQFILLSILLFIQPPTIFNWTAIGLFAASGFFASTLGRLFNFTSIERLGVPISSTIIGSNPLFSTFLAILFLGEQVDVTTLLGTMLIVGGIAITRSGGQAEGTLRGRDLVLPLASATFYGASSVTRKAALNILPDPVLGAVIGAVTSLIAYATFLLLKQKNCVKRIKWSETKYFIVNGLVLTFAWLSMLTALSTGKVSVVTALGGTSPLFAVLLSAILIKNDELNIRIGLGCITIVIGAIVVTLF
jgi:uncharacterized membrane protein